MKKTVAALAFALLLPLGSFAATQDQLNQQLTLMNQILALLQQVQALQAQLDQIVATPTTTPATMNTPVATSTPTNTPVFGSVSPATVCDSTPTATVYTFERFPGWPHYQLVDLNQPIASTTSVYPYLNFVVKADASCYQGPYFAKEGNSTFGTAAPDYSPVSFTDGQGKTWYDIPSQNNDPGRGIYSPVISADDIAPGSKTYSFTVYNDTTSTVVTATVNAI